MSTHKNIEKRNKSVADRTQRLKLKFFLSFNVIYNIQLKTFICVVVSKNW